MDFDAVNEQFVGITGYVGRDMYINNVLLHGIPDSDQVLQDVAALEVGAARLAAIRFSRFEAESSSLGRIPKIGDVLVWDSVSYSVDDVSAVPSMPVIICFVRLRE
jgi:hypothetical protein